MTSSGTSSGDGTTSFSRLSPELETCFIAAALVLGTQPVKFRDAGHRTAVRNRHAKYFRSVSDILPNIETWPPRFHTTMTDNSGVPLDSFEKLAVAYMWWIDEHFKAA